mgnify:CR=1 FL=1
MAAADIVTITIGHNETPWNSLHDHCDGAHAFFGRMPGQEWAILMYKHLDHHLRQFGA